MVKKNKPTLSIIAGPNGAGKTTLYETKLRPHLKDTPFINADVIQKVELKNPSMGASYEAAQIAEQRRQEAFKAGKSFITESTFSHPSKLDLIDKAHAEGYNVVVYHVNLRSPELAVQRVSARVREGGHNVPEHKIRERYDRNQSLIHKAVTKADRAIVFDNSTLNAQPKMAIRLEMGEVVRLGDNVPRWARDLYQNELMPFSQTVQNAPAASFAEAKKIAAGLGDKAGAEVRIAKVGQRITGPIAGETTMHWLQHNKADGKYYAHFKSVIWGKIKVGDVVTIKQTTKTATQVHHVSKEIMDYQSTLRDLKTNIRNQTVRKGLLEQEARLATAISKKPELMEQARVVGLDKQIKTSAAQMARSAQALKLGRGKGLGI